MKARPRWVNPPNHGQPWTPALDKELRIAFASGMSGKNLCLRFGRTPGAIAERLKATGVVRYNSMTGDYTNRFGRVLFTFRDVNAHTNYFREHYQNEQEKERRKIPGNIADTFAACCAAVAATSKRFTAGDAQADDGGAVSSGHGAGSS